MKRKRAQHELPPPVVPPSDLPAANDLLITAVVGAPLIDTVPVDTVLTAPITPTLPITPSLPVTPSLTITQHSASIGDEVQVKCPNCETVWAGSDLRPHAQWFCGKCDYPLFWALPPKAELVGGGPEGDGALSRLPGTDGRETLSSMACPSCGERNPPDPSLDCLRCGMPLTPRPTAAPIPQVVAVLDTVAPPPPPRRRRVWLSIVVAVLAAVAVATATYLLVHHYR